MNLIGSAGDASVTLQWSAVPGATGYRVYRGSTLVAQTTATGVTVGGLTNGTAYQFDVTAYTAFGESVPSNPLTLTPLAPATSTAGPPNASSPSTTAAGSPPTTDPPATTAPTSTTPSVPGTVPVPPAPPSPFTVVPATGPASGGTTIVVSGRGNVPHAGLSIDGAFATITGFTANSVTATTTIHVVPGTYDVVLYDLFGNQTIVPGAFTYQPVAGLSPPPTTTTTTTVPAPTTTRPNPTSTTRPSPTTTTRPSATTTTPPGPPTTTTPAPTAPPAPVPPAVDQPGRATRLQLAPLPASSPLWDLPPGLWDGMTCRLPSCSG